ncbi:MAG TPA: hypothetical protein VGW78_04070 [Candidatus Babeliales bacterium]|jgi:hypothetical protein|nr:hypothetical protein [Candidatus Babeliales bacterium]
MNTYSIICTILLITNIIHSAEERTSQSCDSIGSWIYNFYAPAYSKQAQNTYNAIASNQEVPRLYQLSDVKPKSWLSGIWPFFNRKPNYHALYAGTSDKSKFSEETMKEMEDILVPAVHDFPEARLPNGEELKQSWKWEKNPFQSFIKFSDIWARIIGKYINPAKTICIKEEQLVRPNYGTFDYYTQLQKQKEQIIRERKILDEATSTLDIGKSALDFGRTANYIAQEKLEREFNQCFTKYNETRKNLAQHFAQQEKQTCINLRQQIKNIDFENKQLTKSFNKADGIKQKLFKRKKSLDKAKRNIKQELDVLTKD